MELSLTPEQETRLIQMAEHEDKTPSQFVSDALISVLDADRLFRERLQRGIDQANAGIFIEAEEMDTRFEKMLKKTA